MPKTKDNPKKAFGMKKPPLMELPLSAHIAGSMAHLDGDLKYGFRNWRETEIDAQTYINAAMRHLRLYEAGENFTRDTGVPNLGAVIACCAVLIDAELHGALLDNRAHSQAEADLLHDSEAMVRHLFEMQAQREREKVKASRK